MNEMTDTGGPRPAEGAGEGSECRDQGDFRQVAFYSLSSVSIISLYIEKENILFSK